MPKTYKEITKGNEARLKVKAGIDRAAAAVAPTLGPVGMTALIEYPGLDPIEADDGITILKNLEFEDKHEQMGLQIVRKAALRTSEKGGDGTATTTVLTRALVQAALDDLGADSHRIREVRERLDAGLAKAIEDMRVLKSDITEADIERIANISTLDTEVSKLIAESIKQVGVNGVVTVERGAQLGLSCEVVKGARFDKGLISPFFINDQEHMQTVLEDVYVILVDRKISSNEQIIGLLNSIGTGKNLLFIATDVEGVALATLAQNAVNRVANIACVRNPYNATPAKDFLFDMAALTGGKVISEEMGIFLDKADVAFCGRAEKVIVTRDTTTIIGGKGGEGLAQRVANLHQELESTTSEYQKKLLGDRLAALTGGIGVIRVGAYTDIEYNAKKLKFENGINAAQAALQEGILPGGGSSLLYAAHKAEDPIFKTALWAPFMQMTVNAGAQEMAEGARFEQGEGIDFKTKQYGNMTENGIIDPFKVTRLALESAVTIAKQIVGMETAITTVANEKPAKQ